jgi:hypothetical protein
LLRRYHNIHFFLSRFVHVFFLRETTNYIEAKILQKGTPESTKLQPSPSCRSTSPTRSRTCRWRAAASSSYKPWIRRCPLADGKSSDLELRGASTLLHRPRRLASTPEVSRNIPGFAAPRSSGGRDAVDDPQGPRPRRRTTPPRSCRRRQGGRPAAELRRTAPPERRSTAAKHPSDRASTSLTPPASDLRNPRLCTRRDPEFPHPPAAGAAAGR